MKNQTYVSILAGLALTVCLALSAVATFAQGDRQIQKGPITVDPNLVYLKCAPAKSDVAALVTVTNTSSQAVPQGAKLFVKNQKGLNTSFPLGSSLKAGADMTVNLGGSWTDSAPCSAYAKK
ncbi:MAG: hypothetical protein HYR56_22265 [Acidobacteria bacterium]|nr:hypothetical protein [Acidobacteriota bacterium]MBI3426640.1 hypothetical protein [Acidobacteriota bacterium]